MYKIIVLALLTGVPLCAKMMHATYLTHTDGDTVIFQVKDKRLVCQLDGIDAPELHSSQKLIHDAKRAYIGYDKMQNLGMDSYVYLRNTFIRGVQYQVDVVKGNYKHVQRCMVYLPGQHQSLNERAVLDGYAVLNPKSTILKNRRYKHEFVSLQESAAADRAGLWRDHYGTMSAISR